MNQPDCVLATTGADAQFGPIVLMAVLLLVAGGATLLALSKRHRSALAALALGALLVGSLGMPSTAAHAATIGGSGCGGSGVSLEHEMRKPEVITPTPEPPQRFPDLAASVLAPGDAVDPGSSASVVFTISNTGTAATTEAIEAWISLPPMSKAKLSFDHGATSATVDGKTAPVNNSAFSVAGSGDAMDPIALTLPASLAPGESISVVVGLDVPPIVSSTTIAVDFFIFAGTGGGETPATNNIATAVIEVGAPLSETPPAPDPVAPVPAPGAPEGETEQAPVPGVDDAEGDPAPETTAPEAEDPAAPAPDSAPAPTGEDAIGAA